MKNGYVPGIDRGERQKRWLRIGLQLVAATMLYNVVESVVALWSGVVANSIALVGFGLDSIIETIAAAVMLWRLSVESRGASAEQIERTEHRVQVVVGATFLLLAAYVTLQAVWTFWKQDTAAESTVGMILAAASLLIDHARRAWL